MPCFIAFRVHFVPADTQSIASIDADHLILLIDFIKVQSPLDWLMESDMVSSTSNCRCVGVVLCIHDGGA